MGECQVNKAVFFDRDGVINKPLIRNNKPYSPRTIAEFEFTDGIELGCAALKKAGFLLFIITNQPEISRGNLQIGELNRMNSLIYRALPIKEIFICHHSDEDMCDCRKPSPHMIYSAINMYNINIQNSWVIGDRWKDIDCGINAGCKTIFIDYNYDEFLLKNPNFTVTSVISAINTIIC